MQKIFDPMYNEAELLKVQQNVQKLKQDINNNMEKKLEKHSTSKSWRKME